MTPGNAARRPCPRAMRTGVVLFVIGLIGATLALGVGVLRVRAFTGTDIIERKFGSLVRVASNEPPRVGDWEYRARSAQLVSQGGGILFTSSLYVSYGAIAADELDWLNWPAWNAHRLSATAPFRPQLSGATTLTNWWWHGFGVFSWDTQGQATRFVSMPAWFLIVVLAGVAAPCLFHGRRIIVRERRLAAGRCPACGYEMKGLAPGASCPECGAARG